VGAGITEASVERRRIEGDGEESVRRGIFDWHWLL
jgi:hypothetical protein